MKLRSVVEEWCVLRLYKKKNYLFYVINVFPVHKSHCCDLCFARLILILLDDTPGYNQNCCEKLKLDIDELTD